MKNYKICPYCTEKIKPKAIKCKHCGSIIFEKKSQSGPAPSKQHSEYWTFTIISILLPIIGIFLGIIYLTKQNPVGKKLGKHAIAISVLVMILASGLLYLSGFSPI